MRSCLMCLTPPCLDAYPLHQSLQSVMAPVLVLVVPAGACVITCVGACFTVRLTRCRYPLGAPGGAHVSNRVTGSARGSVCTAVLGMMPQHGSHAEQESMAFMPSVIETLPAD